MYNGGSNHAEHTIILKIYHYLINVRQHSILACTYSLTCHVKKRCDAEVDLHLCPAASIARGEALQRHHVELSASRDQKLLHNVPALRALIHGPP